MAWKSVTSATSWQDLAVASEIALAYDRRVSILTTTERTAAGVSWLYPSGDPSEADQVFTLVKALQTGIAKLYSYFSDPTAALSGSTSYPANYASAAAMFTAAGLTKSGYYRRIAEGGTQPAAWTNYSAPGWSYGTIQSGDLAGPWLWIDLQNALTALTRRIYSLTSATAPNLQVYDLIGFYKTATNTYPTHTGALGTAVSRYAWQDTATFGAQKAITVNWPVYPYEYINAIGGHGTTYYKGRISTLPSRAKNVYILGKCKITNEGDNENWSPDDFGTGWDFGKYDYGNVNIFETIADTEATSIDFWNPPMIPSWNNLWTTLLATVPWPTVNPATDIVKTNTATAWSKIERAAVDFDFDP